MTIKNKLKLYDSFIAVGINMSYFAPKYMYNASDIIEL